MKTKTELDKTTAALSGIPPYVVKMVTGIFLDAVRAGLLDDGTVRLDSLGTLTISTTPERKQVLVPCWSFKAGKRLPSVVKDIPVKVSVYFTKADALKKALKVRYAKEGKSSGKSKR